MLGGGGPVVSADSVGRKADLSESRKKRVAIVGAGPSGMFCAAALLRSGKGVRIDILERLALPYGLVRYGVAPDHLEIRRVTRQFDRVLADGAVSLRTGVQVGESPSVEKLRREYDAVVLAMGADRHRRLGISGEDLPGSYDAGAFVGWYNGHPDFADRRFDLGVDTAVVIGNGNVAIDMARILGRSPRELAGTDLAPAARELLAASRIRRVIVVGRRGPVQASFTPVELRELTEMERAMPVCDASELALDEASRREAEALTGQGRAALDRLISYAVPVRAEAEAEVRIEFRFLCSPIEIVGRGKVESVRLCRNRLVGEPGDLRAEPTAETETILCGLVLRSIGYQADPMTGVPFDEVRCVIPNGEGRVDGQPGLYVTGWSAYGARGLIGTAKKHATAVAGAVLTDMQAT